jgi:hypothetical protein
MITVRTILLRSSSVREFSILILVLAEQVRPKDYALLRKLKNLRDLALVNLRSLPPELDLGHFVNLNSLEISGTQANLRIIGLYKLVNLKRLM